MTAAAGTNEPTDVRAGEELDLDKLTRFIHQTIGRAGAIAVKQFPGGHSNLTYLVEHGDAEYVLRRPPFGSKVKTAHDMGREHAILSALAPVFSKAPRPIAYCADDGVLGAPFYLMERKRGIILRKDPPADRPFDPATARRVADRLIDAMVELHAIDYRAAGLGDFGKPVGYVERQVKGWTERYHGSRTDELPVVLDVAAWLDANRPPDNAPALIHNDFKFDNVIFDDDLAEITGILDWEMSTVGDPLMDVGTALGYWVDPGDTPAMIAMRFGLTHVAGMPSRRDVAARYAAASGRDLSRIVFYYAFGLFKTAVVAQQIYYRWHQGLTKDPRFGALVGAVTALCEQARGAIDRGEL
jgi:aminoglycoside phosphotransferase (APT) family kinase protein